MIEYAVLGGFVLDCLFGDPAWLPHPVVFMGKAISALEKRLRACLPKTPQGELLGGAIVAFCLPVGTFLLTSLVCLGAARISPWLGLAVQMFWCGQALAAKGLAQESTCAGALGVQLAGPAYYFGEYYAKPTIGDPLRPIEPEDILRANRMMYVASAFALAWGVAIRAIL